MNYSSPKFSGPYLKKDAYVYVPVPVVSDSLDTLLSDQGWTAGRFAYELRAEVAFQLQKKDIRATSQAADTLLIQIQSYRPDSLLNATYIKGQAVLITQSARKTFDIIKPLPKKTAGDAKDNILDNLRFIAQAAVFKTTQNPSKAKPSNQAYEPQVWMIF